MKRFFAVFTLIVLALLCIAAVLPKDLPPTATKQQTAAQQTPQPTETQVPMSNPYPAPTQEEKGDSWFQAFLVWIMK